MNVKTAPRVAQRQNGLTPFLVMELMERAFEMEAAGDSVVHLEVGEPGFDAPAEVVAAAEEAMRSGHTHYTDSRGLLALRQAISENCRQRFGVTPDPDCILVTSGTSPAMLLVFSLLVDPGSEVILPEPFYACYPNFIRVSGGEPIFVPTDASDGFCIDPDRVKKLVTSRTRAIVVASPSNPTGAIQSREVLQALAEIGPPLVSDELYHGLVYDEGRAVSALETGGDCFVLDGFSKRYAMTGFRIGWLVAPAWAARSLRIMQQNFFISAGEVSQRAALEALNSGAGAVESMRAAYHRRRDRLVEGLRALGFGVDRMPQGAFYVLADARRFGADSLELAYRLLERAHVAVAPGIDFGASAEGSLRFCYAVSDDAIEEALDRMARVLPTMEISQTGGGPT